MQLRVLLTIALLLSSCSSTRKISSPSPDPVKSTLTSDRTSDLLANGTDNAIITLSLVNAQGQALSGVHVAITATGDGAQVTTAPVTDANGKSIVRLSSSAAGVKLIVARVIGGSTITHTLSIEFVSGPGAKLAFIVPPSTAQAGTAIAPPVQVAIEDSFGNIVPTDAGQQISIALGQDGGTGTLTGALTAPAGVDGTARFDQLSILQAGQGYQLSATANGLASAISAPFDVTIGPPAGLTFSTQPSGVVMNAPIAPAIAVQLKDAVGNLDTSATAMVSLALASGCGNASGPAHLSGTLSVAAVAGVASFNDISLDRAASGCSLVATAQGYAGTFSAPFDINPGAACAATSTLSAAPVVQKADGIAEIQLQVAVRDCAGDPVSGEPVSVTATGPGNHLGNAGGMTNAGGNYAATLTSTSAGDKTVTAIIGVGDAAVVLTAVVTLTPGVPSASTSTLDVTPEVVADGLAVATVTLTTRDLTGNIFPGAGVTINVSGNENVFNQGVDGGSGSSGTTDSNGQFSAQFSSVRAETKIITVTLGEGPARVSMSAVVTFMPGVPSASTSLLSANPNTLLDDGLAATTLQLLVTDANGNAVAGAPVVFSASGGGNTFSSSGGRTNASGALVTTLTSTQAQTETIEATIGQSAPVVVSTPVTFLPPAVVQEFETIRASQSTLVADGIATTTLTVSIQDINGNGAVGYPVVLSASGSGNTFNQGLNHGSTLTGTTDSNGRYVATLSSTHAGTEVVTATSGALTASTAITMTAGAASAAQSSLNTSPATVALGGSVSLLVLLADANGNPLSGQSFTLSASGAGNSFSASGATSGTTLSAITGSNGIALAQLVSTIGQTENVLLTVAGASQPLLSAPVTFVSAPIVLNLALSASSSLVVADGTTKTTLTATVRDQNGNAVSNQTVAFSVGGSGNTIAHGSTSQSSGTLLAATSAAGTAVFTWSSTRAEAKVATAQLVTSSGTLSASQAVTFNAGAPSAAKSVLVATPGVLVADGVATTTLLVIAHDINGNPIPGLAISFGATGSGNQLANATGQTDASGSATATLSSSYAEAKTMTVTLGNGNGAPQLTTSVTFTSSTPTLTLRLGASQSSVVADGASSTTLTAVIQDANGHAVAGVPVTLSASGSGHVFTSSAASGATATGNTDSNGQYVATLTSTKAGLAMITAATSSLVASTTVTFNPGAASALQSTLSATPSSVATGASVALLVLLADANGNPIAGQSFRLSGSGSGNTFSASGATSGSTLSLTTGSGGLAQAQLSSSVGQSENVLLTLTGAGSALLTAPVTFVSPPVVLNLALAASSSQLIADGTTTTSLTATVQDQNGNAISNQTVSLAVSGSANQLAHGVASSNTGTLSAATDVTGTCVFTWSSTRAEAKVATAQLVTAGGTLTATQAITFNAGAASAAKSLLVAAPGLVVADGSATTTLTVIAHDANGNPINGLPIGFGATGSGDTLTGATGTTDASGSASATLSSTHAESKTITATLGSGSGAAQLTTTVLFTNPAAATTIQLAASVTSLVADAVTMTTLTVSVRDANGNAVSGQAVSLGATGSANTFASSSSGAVVTHNGANVSGTTDASGSFVATLASSKAETKIVTATAASASASTAVTLTPGAASANNSFIVASPETVTADGHATTNLRIFANDAYANAIPGEPVSLTVFNDVGANIGNTLSATHGSTTASGLYSATLASTIAETKHVTATLGAGGNAIQVVTSVSFITGAPVLSAQIVASPSSVVADGSAVASMVVTIQDANGNVVSGQSVVLTSSGTANSFKRGAGNGTVAGDAQSVSGTTDTNGQFKAALASTKAESKLINAAIGTVNASTSVQFIAGPADSHHSSLIATPASVAVGGSAVVLLILNDSNNNPISGQSVTLAADGAGNAFTPTTNGGTNATGATNAGGIFIASLSSSQVQSETVSATLAGAGSALVSTGIQFAPIASSRLVTISATPSEIVADGNSSASIIVTVTDIAGNPLGKKTVYLAVSGSNDLLTGGSSNTSSVGTDENGQATFTLASTTAEAKVITATVDMTSVNTVVTFIAGPPDPGNSSLEVRPLDGNIDPADGGPVADGTQSYLLAVQLADSNGNMVKNQFVFISGAFGTESYAPNVDGHIGTFGATDANGQLRATTGSTTAGEDTYTATAGSLTLTATALYVAGPPDPTGSTLVWLNPTNYSDVWETNYAGVIADNVTEARMRFVIADQFGNPAGQWNVRYSVEDDAGVVADIITPPEDKTSADGISEFTVMSAVAEVKSVVAQVDGPSGPFTVRTAVTFVPGPIGDFSAGFSTNPAAAGTLVVARLYAYDQNGNIETPVARVGGGYIYGYSIKATDGSREGQPDANGLLSWNISKPAGSYDYTFSINDEVHSVTVVSSDQKLVFDDPPAGLAYWPNSVSCEKGISCAFAAPACMGSDLHFSINPALPAGLLLDPNNGALSGIATGGASVGDYTVTASNAAGSTDTKLGVTVTMSLVTNGDRDVLAAGSDHACVVANGGAWCWGSNAYGALGNNTTVSSSVPVQVTGLTSGVQSVAAGLFHSCALVNGGVRCWGDNSFAGQLGNNTTISSGTPVSVVGLTAGVKAITATQFATCALANGGVWCWGMNLRGHLGNNTTVDSPVPVQVTGLASGVDSISTSNAHACAIASGNVWCWGTNGWGELGNNATTDSLVPVRVQGLSGPATEIATGSYHSCAVTNGTVQCWGYNGDGELGNNTTGGGSIAPVTVAGLTSGVRGISAGWAHTCAMVNGAARCWGLNTNGQLGNNYTLPNSPAAISVTGLPSGVQALTLGDAFSCALENGAVKCWGGNARGQLGNGTTQDSAAPVQVSQLVHGIQSIAAGSYTTCAVVNGGAQCWGYGNYGELGNGLSATTYVPQQVSGLTSGVEQLSVDADHGCAVVNGAALCWGIGGYGELGDGNNTTSLVPVQVRGMISGVQSVAAGYGHSCAVASGHVWCWGHNNYGQLGIGSTVDSVIPAEVGGLLGGSVKDVAAGVAHSCALQSGSVYCWGDNAAGQLGNNSTNASTTPVQVTGLTSGVSAIAVGDRQSCAILNGAVRCWGDNSSGALGNNSTVNSSVPVAVNGISAGAQAISSKGSMCAVVNGAAECWGLNMFAQLGTHNEVNSGVPVVVTGLTSGVQGIAAGGLHNCAIINGGMQCLGGTLDDVLGRPPDSQGFAFSFSPLPVVGLIGLPAQ